MGETGKSEEFGNSFKQALNWLLKDKVQVKSSHGYPHAIKSIAISEAYALLQKEDLKESMKECMDIIISGAQNSGSFDYSYKLDSDREDLSFAAWNYQALKSAYNAGYQNPELKKSISNAIKWLKTASKGEGFPYCIRGNFKSGEGKHTMRAAGVYSLQIFGEGSSAEIKGALRQIASEDYANLSYNNPPSSSFYGWYYATQAMFFVGGRSWDKWSKRLESELQKNQHRDGYWEYLEASWTKNKYGFTHIWNYIVRFNADDPISLYNSRKIKSSLKKTKYNKIIKTIKFHPYRSL